MKNILRAEKEQTKLTLRKNKLFNILSSKRKIIFHNETDSSLEQEYLFDVNDIAIPDELKIDLNKFFQNVITINNNNYILLIFIFINIVQHLFTK